MTKGGVTGGRCRFLYIVSNLCDEIPPAADKRVQRFVYVGVIFARAAALGIEKYSTICYDVLDTREKPTPIAWRQRVDFSDGVRLAPICNVFRQVYCTSKLHACQGVKAKGLIDFTNNGAGLPLMSNNATGGFCMSENTTNSTKMTPEQLARRAEYLRKYRRLYPRKVQCWRDRWILKRAKQLQAQAEAEAVTDDGEH